MRAELRRECMMHAISKVDKIGHRPQLFGCTSGRSQLDGVVSTTLNEWLMGIGQRVGSGNG